MLIFIAIFQLESNGATNKVEVKEILIESQSSVDIVYSIENYTAIGV